MSAKLASLAVLGASAGGVGAFGIYQFINKKDKVKTFTDEEYQLIFKEFKSNSPFIETLKSKNPSITKQSSNEEGGKATKDWCLNNNPEDTKKWCVQLPKTVREKIGKPMSSNWQEKLKAIPNKEDSNLLNDLKTIKDNLTTITDANKDSQDALQGWCESKWNTSLISDEGDVIYTKVRDRCVDG